ncbi:DUF6777 domain-containing protein [Streptomyces sp. FZ201]|uniref:DUF6777 domain-containing protein n=1 Tax=Streptomyces sp. FZ201 TaxID=3057122 RepID=UPI0021C1C3D7|nr:DUF6777 domain-containing protein [Streptomyces sp. FZ201]
MRTLTGLLATACALTMALLVTGCAGLGGEAAASSGEVLLQPVAARGPAPFTDSTATSSVPPPPVARTPQPSSGEVRAYSGATPGLYAGTAGVGSCDVARQIDRLTADPGRASAFAGAVGVSGAGVPGYLRGLAPVVLRADTRVTNHGYRNGRAVGFQSVLQAGTAVLVDDRGLPRVRCACGNPLGPPRAPHGSPGAKGEAWPGYRPEEVVVVTPAPRAITNVTIINVVGGTWIERRIWHDVRHDRPVPRPEPLEPSPVPEADHTPDRSPAPDDSPVLDDRLSPGGSLTPADPSTVEPLRTGPARQDSGSTPDPTLPEDTRTIPDSPDDIGPESVPETPDLPDGGGLIPDDTEDPRDIEDPRDAEDPDDAEGLTR